MTKESISHFNNEVALSWWADMSVIAGDVANYCDKSEYIESPSPSLGIEAALCLRGLALEIADYENENIFDLYVNRIDQIEARNVLDLVASRSKKAAEEAQTWDDLQQVQYSHDIAYHPDVVGMSKKDQVRHHSFHLAKINKALALDVRSGELSHEFKTTRLPDMLIFGVAIATAFGQKLEDTPLPR